MAFEKELEKIIQILQEISDTEQSDNSNNEESKPIYDTNRQKD